MKNMKWKVTNETIDNLPDDVKPFCKEEMNNADIGLLGMYLLKEKLRRIKTKIKEVFKREKNKKDNC